jgi:hypothetical protein
MTEAYRGRATCEAAAMESPPDNWPGRARRSSRLSRPELTGESGWAAVGMTQQYLAGELSLRLARLQAVAANQGSVREVAHLRREVETGPLTALPSVVMRALGGGHGGGWG